MATAESTVTVIGESVKIRGNLRGDEDLHVLGRVEGSLDLDRTLVVAESGIVKAEVKVRNAVISGVVVGNIHASESVEITREGRMVGDIEAPRVIIVDGASFRGNVDMGDMGRPVERRPVERRVAPPPRPELRTTRPDVRARPQKPEPVTEVTEADVLDEEEEERHVPEKTTVVVPAQAAAAGKAPPPTGRPLFMDAPKAKSLPKKSKTRVVVKRR